MDGYVGNSQLYCFNNSSIGKICIAKYEAENGQIIIIQGIYKLLVPLAMKTCVPLNAKNHRQENKPKIKLTHQNLTSQILSVCLFSKSGRICSFY
jgi:hypothetical protein